ncbi:hypothetical protein EVAR_22765_1 [Eumeta japonica]|uniref:Uncharacterized protein n=1 Tax=Eumeta variegata TaxID=151549 RepID=A0A4C1UTS0_EUMVA|nr:hypothetical protein EVAR_22765_1 [Eumeta japonica]
MAAAISRFPALTSDQVVYTAISYRPAHRKYRTRRCSFSLRAKTAGSDPACSFERLECRGSILGGRAARAFLLKPRIDPAPPARAARNQRVLEYCTCFLFLYNHRRGLDRIAC